jgi:hypothetical protein
LTVRFIYAILIAGLLATPAFADPPHMDTSRGTWVNDEWVPSGNCPPENDHLRHSQLSGTITGVKGHLVTVQQTARAVVINDQPALDAKQTGKVAVGRTVIAYGYRSDGTFYATAIY